MDNPVDEFEARRRLDENEEESRLLETILALHEQAKSLRKMPTWHICGDVVRPYPRVVCSAKHAIENDSDVAAVGMPAIDLANALLQDRDSSYTADMLASIEFALYMIDCLLERKKGDGPCSVSSLVEKWDKTKAAARHGGHNGACVGQSRLCRLCKVQGFETDAAIIRKAGEEVGNPIREAIRTMFGKPEKEWAT